MEKQFNFVYLTTNLINGKQYVGDHSTNNLNDNYLGTGVYFQNALKKYGKNNFKRQILKLYETKKEAFDAQSIYINEYNTLEPNGYNISPKGGHQSKDSVSLETRKKIGIKHKGKKISDETRKKQSILRKDKTYEELYGVEKAINLKQKHKTLRIGKKHKKETIDKIKEKRKNQIITDETRNKISKSLKGKPISQIHKKHIGDSNKFKTYYQTQEFRNKISAANLGKKRTPEMKKNISEAHKGIKPSKENLEKRSISMLGKNTYKRTEETKLKMSIKSKGIKKSEKHINNMRIAQQKRRLKEKQI